MVVYCAYCRRGNAHLDGVCDGCGAPLPEVKDYTNHTQWGSAAFQNYQTARLFSNDIGTRYEGYYSRNDEGYHNRRLK